MTLSKDWMPGTLPGKVAMATNIAGKIAGHAAALGLSGGKAAAIAAFCNALVTAYNHKIGVEAGQKATDTWFNNVLNGTPVGDPSPDAPTLPVQGAIAALVLGWVKQMREYRKDWVAADGYTEAIGDDLMITASGEEPDTVEPTLTATAAQSGYGLIITVTNRGDADMTIPRIKRKTGGWVDLDGFTGRTFEYTITPASDGDPETLEVQLQLMRKNQPYGLLSQIATVTIVP